MYRGISIALAAVCLAFPAAATTASSTGLRSDLDHYFAELERIHLDPYHATSATAMRAAADSLVAQAENLNDDQVLVELMRLVALLGERDGHAGLYPLDTTHRRTLHAYPFWTYLFPDGVYAVAAAGPAVVGQRLVAVDGRPIEEVLRLIEPLETRDNEQTVKSMAPHFIASAEVLHGLGITASAQRATFTFETRAGARRDVSLTPLTANAFASRLKRAYPWFVHGLPRRPKPLFVSHRGADRWLTTLDRGRVVYVSYNAVLGDTYPFAQRLLRAARKPKVRRVIVDLRNNPGGDIGTYPPLLTALASRTINRPNRLVLLIGRTTFSAAVHFTLDVQRTTQARLIGEPTGGAPNHWSDTSPVRLESTGYTVRIPRRYYEKRPGQNLLTVEPTLRVDLNAASFFAGRDPVLQAALR